MTSPRVVGARPEYDQWSVAGIMRLNGVDRVRFANEHGADAPVERADFAVGSGGGEEVVRAVGMVERARHWLVAGSYSSTVPITI